MEITEVRVKLVAVKNDKLRAFCSITVDNDFVIRDLKVIEGSKGAFVAMPSRKVTERCPRCNGKNHHRARFCNDCGTRLSFDGTGRVDGGRDRARDGGGHGQRFHTDIAHPINARCREAIQKRVLEVYQEEIQRSAEPGYKPMEYEVFDEESLVEETASELGVPGRSAAAGEAGAIKGSAAAPSVEGRRIEPPSGADADAVPVDGSGRLERSGGERPPSDRADRDRGGSQGNRGAQQGRNHGRRDGNGRSGRRDGRDGERGEPRQPAGRWSPRGDQRGNQGGEPRSIEPQGPGAGREHGAGDARGAIQQRGPAHGRPAGEAAERIEERERSGSFSGTTRSAPDRGAVPEHVQEGRHASPPKERPAPADEAEDNFGVGLFN